MLIVYIDDIVIIPDESPSWDPGGLYEACQVDEPYDEMSIRLFFDAHSSSIKTILSIDNSLFVSLHSSSLPCLNLTLLVPVACQHSHL